MSWKSVEKIQILLKCDKNNAYYVWKSQYILIRSRLILLGMRNMPEKNVVEKIKIYFVCDNILQKILPS